MRIYDVNGCDVLVTTSTTSGSTEICLTTELHALIRRLVYIEPSFTSKWMPEVINKYTSRNLVGISKGSFA